MNDFIYYTPTKVIFGKNALDTLGTEVSARKAKKVLVHYGGKSAKASGLLDRVYSLLDEAHIPYVSLGGVVPNPRLSLVRQGIELGRAEQVDFILAVGGGSVIDSSKAIGYGLANEGDVWDFYEKKRTPEDCVSLGVILTIAAAGSEMSNSSVITNEEGWKKRGCNSDLCRPGFAILAPELTMSLPDYQTASGCVDIMMHTMERYFNQADNMELTDGMSENLLRTVMKHAIILRDHPYDYHSRAEIMWAGSLSHNGLMGCGTDGGDWATHQLEHELSGMYDVAHGAGLSAVWGSWARYVIDARPERFARFAKQVTGLERRQEEDDLSLGLRGIEALEGFFTSIRMPVTIEELGVRPTKEELSLLADKCSFFKERTIGCVKKLDRDAIYEIYRSALAKDEQKVT